VFVDLLDPRFIQVICEIQGDDTQVLENLLDEGDTFIDVGANHGSFAIVASHLVGSDGHVCAFEPQPRLSELVRQSLQECTSSHEVHQVALGDSSGEVSLFIPVDTSGSAGLHREHSATHEHHQIDVPKRTFDEIVDWEQYPGSLVLKLDVEGNELPFLEGAKEMIGKKRPVLILEINPETLKASGHTGEELKNTLLKHGYETYSSPSAPQTKRPLSELPVSDEQDMIIR
jgi:FkbM family methyltransferase